MSLAAVKRTIIHFDNQSVVGFIRLLAIVYLDKKEVSSDYIVTDKQTTLEIIN